LSEDGEAVRYDELNNEVDDDEALSDSDLSSSDADPDDEGHPSARSGAALDPVFFDEGQSRATAGAALEAEDDFASAVARAAEMAGLTVVGSTVTDSNKGQ